ncbi:hypothetical protein CPB83DRAFT_659430 [Crepidotus variabilis]|uniref:adenosine deaminase n=1 Tax=Crepidotus variabilis TaxID=179855 RepID=A0A9P6JU45_9AGAR|nr:hypothetical protein CPB83DRAFT_659430 [Crepidotus variabilis]
MTSTKATSFQEYQAQREAFIKDDRSLRREFLPANLNLRTSKEAEADRIVREIRALEEKTIWREDYTDIPHPFPGMEFLTGKRIIEKTRLFKILSKMPKGGLLHAHLDATVDTEYLYRLAFKYPIMHIRVIAPLSASTLVTNPPEFRALPKAERTNGTSLAHAAYEAGSWVPLTNARESFPKEMGGPEGFDKWVIGSLTINPSEAYGTHNTVEKIWQKFRSTFFTATGLIRFTPIFAEYIKEFLRSSIADGILYVEPRVNFWYKNLYGENGEENVQHRDLLQIFDRIVKEVKEEMAQAGRAGEFIGAKIIYSTVRLITPEELEWYFADCITLKKEFPHLIAGFDLVGPENDLKPLIYYAKELLAFQERVKAEGLDIPFIFHAGETFGDGTEADTNLYDAILLGTKRIGHGFSLFKHPKLMKICREKGILLEVCPISNEVLRLTSSMPMHPLPALINNGVPVALCSDDPSVFGSMGLTYDYFQVLAASEVTGLSTLGALARDSIEFSSLEREEKARALEVFEKKWDEFVNYVVEYENQ